MTYLFQTQTLEVRCYAVWDGNLAKDSERTILARYFQSKL